MSNIELDDSFILNSRYKKHRTVRCPECKSTNTAKILYGMPDFDEHLERQLEEGRVWLGGCSVMGDDPIRHCNECENDY